MAALDLHLDMNDEPEASSSRLSDEEPLVEEEEQDLPEGMDPEGFSGPTEKIVKPLTREALVAFQAAQNRAGVIYISRIPPGMRPTKVRHLMSAYGEVGRVYLQQEDAKRAYLRRKYTSTKKAHFTEGWVEFKDKKVARSVAEMLNAEPIGGKKGTRWRDDVWTMKYLPKFKWNMLTEQIGVFHLPNPTIAFLPSQIAHEAAVHTAKLRVEIAQSRAEQRDYLKNVELARVLDKRAEKKREKGEVMELKERPPKRKRPNGDNDEASRDRRAKKLPMEDSGDREAQMSTVLNSIF
ncbi:Pre-rRNA-processing protein ESF2 [Mycena sanguinolenta]|uniref:18S rRNA factor 2 n=1 Tax=Mycena sanguinolenta TaxID=230812 RepID=A0A8H7D154_9AGAR|nr:Pre-rRNA-processing protein ESF2 [Mycena sanguinolenta]